MSLPWWWSHKLSSAKSENILVRWRGPQMNQLFFVSFVKVREAPSGWGHEATGLSETKKSFCNQGMRAWLTVRQSCNQLLLWEKKQFIFFLCNTSPFRLPQFFFLNNSLPQFYTAGFSWCFWEPGIPLDWKIHMIPLSAFSILSSFGTICILHLEQGFPTHTIRIQYACKHSFSKKMHVKHLVYLWDSYVHVISTI